MLTSRQGVEFLTRVGDVLTGGVEALVPRVRLIGGKFARGGILLRLPNRLIRDRLGLLRRIRQPAIAALVRRRLQYLTGVRQIAPRIRRLLLFRIRERPRRCRLAKRIDLTLRIIQIRARAGDRFGEVACRLRILPRRKGCYRSIDQKDLLDRHAALRIGRPVVRRAN